MVHLRWYYFTAQINYDVCFAGVNFRCQQLAVVRVLIQVMYANRITPLIFSNISETYLRCAHTLRHVRRFYTYLWPKIKSGQPETPPNMFVFQFRSLITDPTWYTGLVVLAESSSYSFPAVVHTVELYDILACHATEMCPCSCVAMR